MQLNDDNYHIIFKFFKPLSSNIYRDKRYSECFYITDFVLVMQFLTQNFYFYYPNKKWQDLKLII
jgi:hypothetical protein